ncbi:hypothetical protein P3S67_004258 [Capsicum chacoense]
METSTTKPKITNSTSEGIDGISSLSDDILHNILSSLYIFDVFQLSVLSKRWRYIWTTMPYLHLDLNLFYSERINQRCDLAMVVKFRDFINWVLICQRANKLVCFLLCCNNIFDKVVILRWIHAITRQNVQQVVLEFSLGEPFELPYCLVNCESLQVLKLHMSGGILKLPNHLGFRQLKLLHLEQVQLSNEHFTSWLISKCGFLETLILEDCGVEGMRLLDIASTSFMSVTLVDGISNVESYGNCEIKISCPSLKFFKYSGPVPKDIVVENLFSIEVVCINLIDRGSTEERGIMLHNMIKEVHHSISDLELLKIKTPFSCFFVVVGFVPVSFYKLKSLKLEVVIHEESMQVMILLLKYSPNLEVLKLWSDENVDWYMNWQLLDLDESIVCLESHLKSIHLTGFKGDEDEIELVRFFLMNARVLEKLMIFWEGDTYNSEEASEEVLKLPRTVVTLLDAKPGPRTLNWYNRYSK